MMPPRGASDDERPRARPGEGIPKSPLLPPLPVLASPSAHAKFSGSGGARAHSRAARSRPLSTHGVLAGPFPRRLLVAGVVGLVVVRDLGHKRVVRVGIASTPWV